MINIAFATSSRSDFGIMKNLCIKLNQHKKINFKLIAIPYYRLILKVRTSIPEVTPMDSPPF